MQGYEEILLTKIKPYENNPRNNTQAINGVAKSIQDFGFQQPIVVDRNMVIIAGHTRYLAAKKLGLKTVPIKIADLTEEQANAYRLVDNKVSELSFWDNEKLFEELSNIDIDLSDFGFDIDFGGEQVLPEVTDTASPTLRSEAPREIARAQASEWLAPTPPTPVPQPVEPSAMDININNVERASRIEHALKIDSTRIFMTDEEYEALIKKYNDYVEKNGVSYGFVRYLCSL